MKKLLATLALALASLTANADGLTAHMGSWHDRPGYNNFNPGLGWYSSDGWVAGVYYNSHKRPTVYVGHEWWFTRHFGFAASIATGYDKVVHRPLTIIGGLTARVQVAPKTELHVIGVPSVAGTSAVVHVMLRRGF